MLEGPLRFTARRFVTGARLLRSEFVSNVRMSDFALLKILCLVLCYVSFSRINFKNGGNVWFCVDVLDFCGFS